MPTIAHAAATRYLAGGLSVIPVRAGGSKAPALPWQVYQARRATPEELWTWFGAPQGAFCPGEGLAVIGGRVSGNLEVLDFDDPTCLRPWAELVAGELGAGWLRRLPVTRTPSGGTHLFYRCPGVQGNQKLAQRPGPAGRPATCIETRGEGGYVLVPPTTARYHSAGLPYRLLRGDLAAIPGITEEERETLLAAARRLNTWVAAPAYTGYESHPAGRAARPGYERPGDRFNREHSWFEVLEPHGWRPLYQRDGVTFWQRPGKPGRGVSATTSIQHGDVLYVFSSNAHPFEAGHAYSKFAALALLEWAGNFGRAAEALADEIQFATR